MNVQTGMSEWRRRIIGLMTGFLLWSIWGLLVYSISSFNLIQNNQIDIHDSLGTWIYLGPIPLIAGAGFYFVNHSYWPDMKQKEQSAVLSGGVTGFYYLEHDDDIDSRYQSNQRSVPKPGRLAVCDTFYPVI